MENENLYKGMSLDEARKLINDDTISNEDLERIIEDLYVLCEIFGSIYRETEARIETNSAEQHSDAA